MHGIGYEGSKARDYLIKAKSKNQMEAKKEIALPLNVDSCLFSSITTFFFKQKHLISSFNFMVHHNDPSCFSIAKLQLSIQKFSEGWKELWKCEKVRLLYKNNAEMLQKIKMDVKLDNYNNTEIVYLVVISRNCIYYSKINNLDAKATII